MNFSSYLLPEDIYLDCGHTRYCGLLRWDETSRNILYDIIYQNKTSNKLESEYIEPFKQFDLSVGNNWIYFCQTFNLYTKLKNKQNDPDGNPPMVSFSTSSSSPRYFSRIRINLSTGLFRNAAGFNQLDFTTKIKNTKSFIRSKNIKIFYDFDFVGKTQLLMFNSMFFNSFSGLNEMKYILASFDELIKNKTIDFKFDNKTSYLNKNSIENIIEMPEIIFPRIIDNFEYQLEDKNNTEFSYNYLENSVNLDFTNYLEKLVLKLTEFLDFVSEKNLCLFLKNNFSLDESIVNSLTSIKDRNGSFEEKIEIIKLIIFHHGRLILTNQLSNRKFSFNDIITRLNNHNNFVIDSTNKFDPIKLSKKISIKLNDLNSAKYLIAQIRDNRDKLLFTDYQFNILNNIPMKNVKIPLEGQTPIDTDIIENTQELPLFPLYEFGTLINCFWFNVKNSFWYHHEKPVDFRIGFDFLNYYIKDDKRFSVFSNFQIFNKTIKNFNYSYFNDIKNSDSVWDFNKNFEISSKNNMDYKLNFLNKKWNHFCSFTNLNKNFETAVYVNNNRLVKFQDDTFEFSQMDLHTSKLRFIVTRAKVFLADWKLNLIKTQKSEKFSQLYYAFKYNGMYNVDENFFYFNLKDDIKRSLSVYELSYLKNLESDNSKYINKFLIFDSLEPEFNQIFIENFPKIDKYDEKFLKIRLRFNPDFIFKMFFKSNPSPEFMLLLLKNFKLLIENTDNDYLNDIKMLLDLLTHDSKLISDEIALNVKIDDRIILLKKRDLFSEKVIVIEKPEKILLTPDTINIQVYENRFNICVYSQIFKYFINFLDYRDKSYQNFDKKILNSLDSTAFVISNSNSLTTYDSKIELNSKIDNLENYNFFRSRFFASTFYYDNKILNFTSIFEKDDKSACLYTNIDSSFVSMDLNNFKLRSFFDPLEEISYEIKSNLFRREYFPHSKLIENYNQNQNPSSIYENFEKIKIKTNIKFDEYINKNITELNNNYTFYSYYLQTIEQNKSNIETSSLNYFEIKTENICSKSKEFNSKLSNVASFLNFDREIKIHQNTNILNLKNLNWKDDEEYYQKTGSIMGDEKLVFTIENNYEDDYKIFSDYHFDDNINELKNEHNNDLEFLNILNNINLKINIIKNYRNSLSIFSLQFDYSNKTTIEHIPYNEYFFIDIKVMNKQLINKYYDQIKIKSDIFDYIGKSSENKENIIKIKIFLERFEYKSFSYHDAMKNRIDYYYSLENIFQPLFFSTDKLKLIIQKTFDIKGEIDFPTKINNAKKFQFSSIKIEEISPKFISISFINVKDYYQNDYEINILPSISGLIFKDNKRTTDLEIIPFFHYKQEYLIPLSLECDENRLFLFFKTNYRYIENPDNKVFKISIHERYISFFINPSCIEKIKSLLFYGYDQTDVIKFFDLMRAYIILDFESSIKMNLDVQFYERPLKTLEFSNEKIKLTSNYLIPNSVFSYSVLEFTYVIFNKYQDFSIKLGYEITANYQNRIMNLNNRYLRFMGCKDKLDIINDNKFYVKYPNQNYTTCSTYLKYFSRYSRFSYTFEIINLEKMIDIKPTNTNKLFEKMEVRINFPGSYKTLNHYENVQCSSKLFILAKTNANFIQIDKITSFNFDDFISEANKNLFVNNKINHFIYQIILNENSSDNIVLSLDVRKMRITNLLPQYKMNFTLLENKIVLDKLLFNYFNNTENYDLDFIYTYLSCKICLTNKICDFSYSNVLEFNISDLYPNHEKPFEDPSFNKTIHNNTINNETKDDKDSTIDYNQEEKKNNKSEDTTQNGNETKIYNDSLIFDMEKNSTNLQNISTLLIIDINNSSKIFSSINPIKEIQNGKANLSTTTIDNFTSLTDIKNKIDSVKSNCNILENLEKNKNKTNHDIIKETINVNLILSKVNCSDENSKISEDCKSTKENTQEKILKILNRTFSCIDISNAISDSAYNNKIEHLLDHDNFINSLASLYISSINYDSFSDLNIELINEINSCLLKYGPDLISKIRKVITLKNEDKTTIIEHEFVKMITATSSNMINIAMNRNLKTISNKVYNETENNDLVIQNENIQIKNTIEKNSLLFLKLNKNMMIEKENDISASNFTKKLYKKIDQFKFITNNLVFYSKRGNSDNISRKNKLRYLNAEKESIILNEFGLDVKILFPLNYLKNEYNSNITSYSFIFYNKYPLSSPNSTNFNEKVMSIKLLDHNFEEIPILNITTPIEIFIKRSPKMMHFKKCVFFDEELTNWNMNGCVTQEIGEYIVCSCNHLTDFSLSKYNPVSLVKDIFKVINDAMIINDFTIFTKLNFKNSKMLYVFLILIFVYIYALKAAIKRDLRDENDPYVFQIDEEPKFCSKDEILKKIEFLKEMVDGHEEKRKVNALKILQFKLESSLSEKREIIIDNGKVIEKKENEDEDFKEQSDNNQKSNEPLKEDNFENYEDNIISNYENILQKKKFKLNFLKGLINKVFTKKEYELKKQASISLEDNKEINFDDSNSKNIYPHEIELQTIEKYGNTYSNNSKSNPENNTIDSAEIEEKKNNQSIIDTYNNYSFCKKVFMDSSKLKVTNQINVNKNILLELYNAENKEIKQEIDKFFLIETKDSIKTYRSITKQQSLDKSLQEECVDIEKANQHTLKNNLISPDINSNKQIQKVSSLSTNFTGINTVNCKEENKTENLKEEHFDNNLDDSYFRNNSLNQSINKPFNCDLGEINEEESFQVRIRNYKIIRYAQILRHFFVNNYRLLCLIYYTDMPFSKTNFLTLIISRIILTIGVGTMLSLRIDIHSYNPTEAFQFNNEALAVSISTILLVEIIFTLMEVMLKKKKIYKNSLEEEKFKIKRRAKMITTLTYIFIFFICLFFIINTIWITLKLEESRKYLENKFLFQFILSLFLDFFIKEVIVLTVKAYIFFILIETEEEEKKWKNYLISLLAITE